MAGTEDYEVLPPEQSETTGDCVIAVLEMFSDIRSNGVPSLEAAVLTLAACADRIADNVLFAGDLLKHQ